jgi:ABC-type antimicrobial peptide transport system permease subunit
VVGVVADIKYRSLTQAPSMLFYVPLAQQGATATSLFVRTAGAGAGGVAQEIVGAIRAIDPNVSPYEVLTLREQVNRSTSGERIMTALLSLFASLALFLAAMGLYGVISYMVSQSTRELGVRMALGARPSQLMALVMTSGLRLTLAGIAVGVAIALGTTRLLGNLLFQVSPRDPLVFAAVVVVLAAVAIAACVLPAWRATRLDPVRALRI